MTALRNMVVKFLPELRCAVGVYGQKDPTNDEWSVMTGLVRAEAGRRLARVIAFSDGGGPNAGQRAELHQARGHHPLRVAVVTDTTSARMMLRAIALVDKGIRGFGTSARDVLAALDYLEILDPNERGLVQETKWELQRLIATPVKAVTK